MRSRGVSLDGLFAASAVALELVINGYASEGTASPTPPEFAAALLAGLPMGVVRQRPAPVTVYLAALVVIAGRLAPGTDSAQILLCVALCLTGYRSGLRAARGPMAAAMLATALTVAAPGVTAGTMALALLLPAAPAVIGGYLHRSTRDVTPDLLLAAGGVLLAVLSTWDVWHSGGHPVAIVQVAAVVSGLALGVARRLPGLVVAVEGVLLIAADAHLHRAADTGMLLLMVAMGVFAMRVASWARTALAYAAGCVVVAVAVFEPLSRITTLRVLFLMTLVAMPIAVGRYFGMRRAVTAAERLRAEEAVRLTLARARADLLAEREHIARDVQTLVAGHVGAMVLRAGDACDAAPDGPVGHALTDIRETGNQVLRDLGNLLHGADLHLDAAELIRAAARRMSAAGLVVDLGLDPGMATVSPVLRTCAASIVQEGLTNVLKHAGPGTRVRVTVAASGGGLSVKLHNGPAPATSEPLPSSGHGLAGMRKRVRALGGTLDSGPDGDGGWLLQADLPPRGGE
ncbi:two-component sensor histidine kinase [Nonomuraea sp. NPDC049504]|uniref:sensor histidine kinase n=1 Tax=Nonomuraea sp. NPDC049504 TaxID=3154729 RepID=UPI0034293F45